MQQRGEETGEEARACAIGVMAKAPIPGRAKTRLTPLLSPEEAAALSAAFLRDVTENVRLAARQVPIRGCIAYAPAGTEVLFETHMAEGTGMVLADGSPLLPPRVQGFGRCLLHAIQAMLDDGARAACVLNSDSPNLPTALLVEAAVLLLEQPDRVVLGPAEDGGYYLLGMGAPHAHLFEDIAWSTDSVAAATRTRARALGLELVELAPWYDVDDRDALLRLIEEIAAPAPTARAAVLPYAAPVTAACLARIGLRRAAMSLAAQ
jgi:rSAM/selenodomain-associated transferase 1